MSELEVPLASHEAASKMRRDLVDYEDLQAIATPIVVAELRQLADEYHRRCANMGDQLIAGTYLAAAGIAIKRANDLEAGQ